MFVVVTDNKTNERLYCRRLSPTEKMDAEAFATIVAEQHFCTVAPYEGHIPSGCGEIRVEFRPRREDSTVIWSGEDFFFRNNPEALTE
jgi:hypothetical protein